MPTEIPLDARFATVTNVDGVASSLPREGVPLFRLATSLGDDPVILDLCWNEPASAWFMDVRDTDESPIILGVKLVLGVNLCRTSRHDIFKRNLLRLIDTSRE